MARPTPSQVLRQELGGVVPPLFGAYRRLVEHPQLASLYPEYLFFFHSLIRASVPLMHTARQQAAAMGSDDVARQLIGYLEKHTAEEQNHDEWVLDDLAELGVNRAQALRRLPSPTVAAMAGSQYYWVSHHHPVALLGYIAVLEGYPASPDDIEDLARRTALPRAAFRTLELHARLDPGHNRELDAFLDALPLTDDHLQAVCTSATATARFAATALRELLAAANGSLAHGRKGFRNPGPTPGATDPASRPPASPDGR